MIDSKIHNVFTLIIIQMIIAYNNLYVEYNNEDDIDISVFVEPTKIMHIFMRCLRMVLFI